MNKRIVLEIDKALTEGDVLIYKDGMLKSADLRNLLPELLEMKSEIAKLTEDAAKMKQTIANLAKIVKEK